MSSSTAAAGLLSRQLKQMQNDKSISGISCGLVESNVFEWEVMLMIDDDTKFYGGMLWGIRRCTGLIAYLGGFFRARLTFPSEYPLLPPKMRFETPIFHPNSERCLWSRDIFHANKRVVYTNGEVCISILHPPEEDKYGYESASERWSPVQTPETILLSVISMLSSPNDESPANVEAASLWRDNTPEFKRRVRKCVRDSLDAE
jgi:ubiquitin-conjugating enzyme E2 G1